MRLDEQYRQWRLQGSEEALNALAGEVRQYAMSVSHDDDIAQLVAITVIRKLGGFDPQDDHAFTRYVSAVTTRFRLKKATERTFEALDEDESPQLEDRPFISLSTLCAFQRDVATGILAGYSLKEIACQMDLKEATLRKKLFDIRNENRLPTDT